MDSFDSYDAGNMLLYGREAGKQRMRNALFSGLNDVVPVDGQAGPVTVVTPPPTLTQQLWGFLKSPLGWLFIGGAIYLANKKGLLEGVKDKLKDLSGDLGDEEEEVQE